MGGCGKKAILCKGAGISYPSGEDICRIVDACGKNGVKRFVFGEMVIHFERDELAPEPTLSGEVPGDIIRAKQKQLEAVSLEEQELQARENQVAELLLTDPLLAEEMMERGELQPSGEASGDEEL